MCRWKCVTTIVLGVLVAAGHAAAAGPGSVTTITGKIIFKGDLAKHTPVVVDTSKDPKCIQDNKAVRSEKVVFSGSEPPLALQNVLVSIKSDFGDRVFPARSTPITLSQRGCRFVPHVLGIMKQQPLRITNDDDTKREVHFLSTINSPQSFTSTGKDDKNIPEVRLLTERPFKIASKTHPWMECYIGVFDHPFHDVTGAGGTYELKGMPPGRHLIEAWHEEFGSLVAEAIVKKGETTTLDFTFDLSKKTPAPKPKPKA